MLFLNNPYNVFGLSIDADDKQINKRYKELSQYLSMDEIPEYSTDIKGIDYSKVRTEERINEVYNILTHQTKKIDAMFFWFTNIDDVDQSCHELLSSGKVVEAANKRDESYKDSGKTYHLKNKIISRLISLENQELMRGSISKDEYSMIVGDLKSLISSKLFWKEFKQIYDLHNDIPIKQAQITNFSNELIQQFAEDFFDLSETIGDSSLYKIYVDVFGVQAKELDDNKNVTSAFKELSEIENKILELTAENYHYERAKYLIESFIQGTKKLQDIGLDKDPKYRKKVDQVANKLRALAISLQSTSGNDTALGLMKLIRNIDITTKLKDKLSKDIQTLADLVKEDSYFAKVTEKLKTAKKRDTAQNRLQAINAIKKGSLNVGLNDYIFNDVQDRVNAIIDQLGFGISGDQLQVQFNNLEMGIKNKRGDYSNLTESGSAILSLYAQAYLNLKLKKLESSRNNYSSSNSSGSSSGRDSSLDRFWWLAGLIVLAFILYGANGTTSNSSSSSSKTPTYNSNSTNSYETAETCLGPDGNYYNRPKNAKCVKGDSYNARICNSGHKEVSDGYNESYCGCISLKSRCSSMFASRADTMQNTIDTSQRDLDNTYVDQYSQRSVNAYNVKANSVNKAIADRNKYLSEYCTCGF